MRDSKKKIIILFVIIMTLLITLIPAGQVKAALQSNPNTHEKKVDIPEDWIKNIRMMEKAGQAMGLDETLKEDLTPTTSNGIDVHMIKSTEYGAIAILSASGYGNPKNWNDSSALKTTTGNKTGVYFTEDFEDVAGGQENVVFVEANSRYYDSYRPEISFSKAGDALGTASTPNPGCAYWHGGEVSFLNYGVYFVRKNFSYLSYNNNGWVNRYSRGVAVCGEGF